MTSNHSRNSNEDISDGFSPATNTNQHAKQNAKIDDEHVPDIDRVDDDDDEHVPDLDRVDDEHVPDIDLGDSKKPKTPVSVIIAGIVLTILTIICLQVDDWSRDWTQNTSETDPAAKDVAMHPIATQLPTMEFADLVIAAMKEVPRWELIEQTDDGEDRTKLDFVHSTFLMRYKDDVAVEIVKTETGSTLYAKSQSRIGKGDLGQNPRNIKELITKVREKLNDRKPKSEAGESKKKSD